MGALATIAAAVVSGLASASAASPEPTAFAVADRFGPSVLVPVDPVSGLRIGETRLKLREYVRSQYTPDSPNHRFSRRGRVLALGTTGCGRIARVDVVRRQVLEPIEVFPSCYRRAENLAAEVLAWPSASRMFVLTGRDFGKFPATSRVRAIDPVAGRTVAQRRVGIHVATAARARGPVVVLSGPRRGGAARLTRVTRDGRIASVTLPRIPVSGVSRASNQDGRVPGLAVDFRRLRAFVLPATGPVAIVHFREMRVSYRTLTRPGLDGDLGPAGRAQSSGTVAPQDGRRRYAHWIGHGRIAVTGQNTAITQDGRQVDTPAGLRIVDTRDWSVRIADRRPQFLTYERGVLLVSTVAWNPRLRRFAGHRLVRFRPNGYAVYRLGRSRSKNDLDLDPPHLHAVNGRIYELSKVFVNSAPRMATLRNLRTGRALKPRSVSPNIFEIIHRPRKG